jgi:hypothetical protein
VGEPYGNKAGDRPIGSPSQERNQVVLDVNPSQYQYSASDTDRLLHFFDGEVPYLYGTFVPFNQLGRSMRSESEDHSPPVKRNDPSGAKQMALIYSLFTGDNWVSLKQNVMSWCLWSRIRGVGPLQDDESLALPGWNRKQW